MRKRALRKLCTASKSINTIVQSTVMNHVLQTLTAIGPMSVYRYVGDHLDGTFH